MEIETNYLFLYGILIFDQTPLFNLAVFLLLRIRKCYKRCYQNDVHEGINSQNVLFESRFISMK